MPPPRRLKPHELQTTPFIPPKRKPGDPPWMYGNDIPESYLRALEAKNFDPMRLAEDRMMEHIKAEKERPQEIDVDDENYVDPFAEIIRLTQEEIDDGWCF